MGDWSQIPGVILFLLSVLLQILMISVFGENLIREVSVYQNFLLFLAWLYFRFDMLAQKFTIIGNDISLKREII